jgi:choline transport protein
MADYVTPESKSEKNGEPVLQDDTVIVVSHSQSHSLINASGHRDQLDRQYGILSICGMALTVDNAWVAIGTSMNVAICGPHFGHQLQLRLIFLADNGGPPGVLYEFLVACFYYCFIAASLAEVCFRTFFPAYVPD